MTAKTIHVTNPHQSQTTNLHRQSKHPKPILKNTTISLSSPHLHKYHSTITTPYSQSQSNHLPYFTSSNSNSISRYQISLLSIPNLIRLSILVLIPFPICRKQRRCQAEEREARDWEREEQSVTVRSSATTSKVSRSLPSVVWLVEEV